MSTWIQIFWNVYKAHLLLRLSSENGFEGRLTLDLPRSTFQDVGDATGEGDTSPSAFDLDTRGGDRLGDFGGRDMGFEGDRMGVPLNRAWGSWP